MRKSVSGVILHVKNQHRLHRHRQTTCYLMRDLQTGAGVGEAKAVERESVGKNVSGGSVPYLFVYDTTQAQTHANHSLVIS